MIPTVPQPLWKKLAHAARQERNPRKFIYLVKELYDLLNYDEGAKDGDPRAEIEVRTSFPRAALAAHKNKAA